MFLSDFFSRKLKNDQIIVLSKLFLILLDFSKEIKIKW